MRIPPGRPVSPASPRSVAMDMGILLLVLASGPPSGSKRYVATRPPYSQPVPPRLSASGPPSGLFLRLRAIALALRVGTSLRDLLTVVRSPTPVLLAPGPGAG